MVNHFEAPFHTVCGFVEVAAANFLSANVARLDTFTQYLLTDVPHVKRGVLTNVMVYCDSANNTTYDLIITEGPAAGDQESQGKFIFDSREILGVPIADNTLETFNVQDTFVLDVQGTIYFSLVHSAAPGNCLGRLSMWGIAYF